jgi:hypothetical protein
MSEKMKNESVKNTFLNRISFLFLWIVLTTGLGIAINGLFSWLLYFIPQTFGISITELTNPSWRLNLVLNLIYTLILSPIQVLLLRRGFGIWLKGWVWASFLGSVLSSLPAFIVPLFNIQVDFQNSGFLFFQTLSILLFVLPQAWILRRYVQNAWLYALIAVPANLFANYLNLYGFTNRMNLEPIATVFVASVMALLWLWLFREIPSHEKAKVGEAMSHERLEDRMEDEDGLEEVEMRQEGGQSQ